MEYKLIKKGEVTSTNTVLKELAKAGEAEKTVVAADSQTMGRGRMGRSFYSPDKTGIYMSILLRESAGKNPTLLTTLAAVAVMKGIESATGKKTQVKWVNDVMLDGKKICGILTEGAFRGSELEYAVVGIGINVSTEDFPDEFKSRAGSLGEDSAVKEKIMTSVLDCFFDELKNMGSGKFLEFYRGRCETVGKNIKIISPNGNKREALAVGIDSNANLIVKYPDSTKGVLFSGEVSVR